MKKKRGDKLKEKSGEHQYYNQTIIINKEITSIEEHLTTKV